MTAEYIVQMSLLFISMKNAGGTLLLVVKKKVLTSKNSGKKVGVLEFDRGSPNLSGGRGVFGTLDEHVKTYA